MQQLAGRWRDGPLGPPAVPALPLRGAPQVFTVRPFNSDRDGDPGNPQEIEGIPVAQRLRVRRDGSGRPGDPGRRALRRDRRRRAGGRRPPPARRVVRATGIATGDGIGRARVVAGACRALSAPATPPDAVVSDGLDDNEQ